MKEGRVDALLVGLFKHQCILHRAWLRRIHDILFFVFCFFKNPHHNEGETSERATTPRNNKTMIQKPPTLVDFDMQEIQTCNANGSLICAMVVVVVVVVGGIGRCRRVSRPLGSSKETPNLTIPRPSLNPSTLLQIYHSLLSPTPLLQWTAFCSRLAPRNNDPDA